MIIGPENVGKTTLLKVLIKQSLLANEAPTQVASGNHPLIELITFDTGDMVKTGLGTLADSKVGLAVLQSPFLQVTRQTLSDMKSQRTNVFDKSLRSKYSKLRPKLSKIQEANTDSNESKKSQQSKIDNLHAVLCDFGDQAEYHVTHQPFMSCDSIYVLVFNIAEEINDAIQQRNNSKSDITYFARMHEWLSSVRGCKGLRDGLGSNARNEITIDGKYYELPIVIVIGSHADKIVANNEEEKNRKIQAAYNNISREFGSKAFSKHLYLSHLAMNGDGNDNSEATQRLRDETRKQLCQIFTKIAEKLPFITDPIPVRWYEIIQILRGEREDKTIKKLLTKTQVKDLIDKHHLSKQGEKLDSLLSYLHNIGQIVYCDKDEILSNWVVSDIDWLIEVFCSLIRISFFKSSHADDWSEYEKIQNTGKISEEYIRQVWSKFNLDDEERKYVLSLMTHYDILCEASELQGKDRIYLIPCLLKTQPKSDALYPSNSTTSKYIYLGFDEKELPYISYNIFYCLISQCLQKRGWNNGRVKLYQNCASFRISPGINLIIDKLSTVIGLQLVYRHPNLQSKEVRRRLTKTAVELHVKDAIESALRIVLTKWMPNMSHIRIKVSVKCPYCGELVNIEDGLSDDKSFLDCLNCERTWHSSYHLKPWLDNITVDASSDNGEDTPMSLTEEERASTISKCKNSGIGMLEIHKQILRSHRVKIIDGFKSSVKPICNHLYSREILTPYLKEIILCQPNDYEKMDKLLDILPERGIRAYDVFREVLSTISSQMIKILENAEREYENEPKGKGKETKSYVDIFTVDIFSLPHLCIIISALLVLNYMIHLA
ncbi:putative serine/threonine-protein kinase pats1 [Trichoplax sp. H2]|nr:putative serine/threonine-protein kinase pats1 [Trichoplax sp. H2]|eukprot:RDD37085.1 putative serine/threonine-protein kinase pats1 [Trichoplax sp. H2]